VNTLKITVRRARKVPRHNRVAIYNEAMRLLEGSHASLSTNDALKEAAHQAGIPWGDPMGRFIRWAEARSSATEAPRRVTRARRLRRNRKTL
jgi:hypothetical protein